jgi:hypothetical protein
MSHQAAHVLARSDSPEGNHSSGVLRPVATLTRMVDDHRPGSVVTFTVRRLGYIVAASATCQAVIGHTEVE